LAIDEADLNRELDRRRPGTSPFTSPRQESDRAQILSGVFEGHTTGAPLSILIPTTDARPQAYVGFKTLLRPGHGTFTYQAKYGTFDYRGGGRASARETACRVAAGAVAKKILAAHRIAVVAYIREIGGVAVPTPAHDDLSALTQRVAASPVRCHEISAETRLISALQAAQAAGDSLGGIVECVAAPLPIGLGDPIYEKLEARLAYAMLSIPASRGFELGDGFDAARQRGSQHNDTFIRNADGTIKPSSNHAGGVLAGISTGLPLIFRVAFKPTSTIAQPQQTVDLAGNSAEISPGSQGRHDPCVAIRAVAVVEAMAALVLADALLMQQKNLEPT
jgi:chorismate synthase